LANKFSSSSSHVPVKTLEENRLAPTTLSSVSAPGVCGHTDSHLRSNWSRRVLSVLSTRAALSVARRTTAKKHLPAISVVTICTYEPVPANANESQLVPTITISRRATQRAADVKTALYKSEISVKNGEHHDS